MTNALIDRYLDLSTAKPHIISRIFQGHSVPSLNTLESFVFIARQHTAADARY